MMDVGELLKLCRVFRKMSQRELARESGISYNTVNRIERMPSCNTKTFFALLDAMGFEWEIIPKDGWKR